MPKEGFKSITVSKITYERFQKVYKQSKNDLMKKGVNSFSGYVTYMLEEAMEKDRVFAAYAPKFENVSIDEDRVILKDNIRNKIVEVVIQNGELFCFLCEKKDCVHIGFVFAMPDVYKILNARGIKSPMVEEAGFEPANP